MLVDQIHVDGLHAVDALVAFSLSVCPGEPTIELTLLRSSPTIELSPPEAKLLAMELDRWLRTVQAEEGGNGDH